MDLAAVGVTLDEITQQEPYTGSLEAIIPDSTKVQALEELAKAGKDDLDDLEQTGVQFQRELQQLADEMRQLEGRSSQLYQKLDTRNTALGAVEPLVAARVVPPAIVGELCFGEIGSPQWRAALVFACQQSGENDSELLRKLNQKVLHRIKDYYVSRIRRLRSPGIDAQIVQQDLINNAQLYSHLANAHSDIAETIKQAYISTIKWYYKMLLEKYLRWIGRQPTVYTDKSSTIGDTLFSSKSFFSFTGESNSSSLFNVGARPTILAKDTRPMVWGTVPPPQKFHGEVLIQSMVTALTDAIIMEDRVLREGFNEQEPPLEMFSETLDHAGRICDKLFGTWDVFDLLLSLKLLEFVRGPAILEEWKAQQIAKICPQITRIIETNSRSIDAAVARPAASRKSGPELHALTTAVASMLTGLLQLGGDSQQLIAPIRQFIGVYEAGITKLSKYSSSPELFLYNNYFLLSSLIGDLSGEFAREQADHFKLLTQVYDPSTN